MILEGLFKNFLKNLNKKNLYVLINLNIYLSTQVYGKGNRRTKQDIINKENKFLFEYYKNMGGV